MNLHPQDVVLVLKLLAAGPRTWTYAQLGEELSMSPSQVFRSVDRAEISHLLDLPFLKLSPPPPPPNLPTQNKPVFPSRPNLGNLKEFLIYGVKYAFPLTRGGLVRGIPTAHAASPLNKEIAQPFEPPPVWPYAEGAVRGTAFSPLYKNVPEAVKRDPKLHELLALVDAIRDGRAREREIAIRELTSRIDTH